MSQWKRRGKGYQRTIAQLCDEINALAEREAAALNRAETYRQQVREMDEQLHALLAWQQAVRDAWGSFAEDTDWAHRNLVRYQNVRRAIEGDEKEAPCSPQNN